MSNELEEIEEGVKRRFQVALIAGLRVGQELATGLKERLDKIKAVRFEEAAQLQAAFDRDRDLAAAELAQTGAPEWWAKATPDDVGRAAALAEAWEPHIDGGTETRAHLFTQLEERYGIRSYETGTSPELIAAQLKVWEQDREREAAAAGGDLTAEAVAEISASEKVQDAARKPSRVRFEPVPGSEATAEATQAEVLAQIAKLPPQEQLTEQHREALSQWARQDPEVDAAIWRKYPEVFPDGPAAGNGGEQALRGADRERGRESTDLAAANLHAQDADRLAGEARQEQGLAAGDPNSPHAAEAQKLRGQAANADVDADLAYDSADRRALSAAVLEEEGVDEQAVEAHMISDTAQGKPAREAVKVKRATKARPSRGAPSRGRGIDRSR
ncbi:hypothetical protein AB3K78_01250 [Leucobacter sp. HNU]|uniref:hypothetical protein n=1 Tax=Leucobacter sp. HNU TaxID=3236805 RepID=UPI003A8047B1